jgi:hypothetical protein
MEGKGRSWKVQCTLSEVLRMLAGAFPGNPLNFLIIHSGNEGCCSETTDLWAPGNKSTFDEQYWIRKGLWGVSKDSQWYSPGLLYLDVS